MKISKKLAILLLTIVIYGCGTSPPATPKQQCYNDVGLDSIMCFTGCAAKGERGTCVQDCNIRQEIRIRQQSCAAMKD